MPRIALLLHVFYPELLPGLVRCARNFPAGTDLLVSAPEAHRDLVEETLSWALPDITWECRAVPNRGRDIAPMLVAFGKRLQDYDLVCKLHTKKSTHQAEHHSWRESLLANLAGSEEIVQGIVDAFAESERLGLYYPGSAPDLKPWMAWSQDRLHAISGIASALEMDPLAVPDFPAGSMYWFRPGALLPLLRHSLDWEDFSEAGEGADDDLAHGIERLISGIAHRQGYTWLKRNLTGGPRRSHEAFDDGDQPGIAVLLHAFDTRPVMEALAALKHLDFGFDLYVTCPAEAVNRLRPLLKLHFPACRRRLIAVPNVGFDVAPFVALGERLLRYRLLLKLHLKRQEEWRRYLFDNLAGGIAEVNIILEMFRRDPDLGVVYPQTFPPVMKHMTWGSNYPIALQLARDLAVKPPGEDDLTFVSSTMFWCRPDAFRPILQPKSPITFDEADNDKRDGTSAHALERLLLHVAGLRGYRHQAVLFHPYRGDQDLALYP